MALPNADSGCGAARWAYSRLSALAQREAKSGVCPEHIQHFVHKGREIHLRVQGKAAASGQRSACKQRGGPGVKPYRKGNRHALRMNGQKKRPIIQRAEAAGIAAAGGVPAEKQIHAGIRHHKRGSASLALLPKAAHIGAKRLAGRCLNNALSGAEGRGRNGVVQRA